MAPEPKRPAVSLSESRVAEGMELRDSSWGWAKRVEVTRRMRRKSGRIKRGVKALNYRLELIENHLSKILKGARGGPRLWPRPGRGRCGAGGWFWGVRGEGRAILDVLFFPAVAAPTPVGVETRIAHAKVAKDGKEFQM